LANTSILGQRTGTHCQKLHQQAVLLPEIRK